MTLKSNVKFEEKLTCCFKNDKNLVKFVLSTQNFHNIYTTMKSDVKFEEKLTCSLENHMRNTANFHQSTRKSQNYDFAGILLSKVENV